MVLYQKKKKMGKTVLKNWNSTNDDIGVGKQRAILLLVVGAKNHAVLCGLT